MKTIKLHNYHTFTFWWCFTNRSWTFWYMLCQWKCLLITFAAQCWQWYRAFLGWLVRKLFSFSTVRPSISFSSMNFKIGKLNKIFLSCTFSCVSLSIFNSSTKEMSSLISTTVLLKFFYFLSNFNWISASDSISYSSRIKCSFSFLVNIISLTSTSDIINRASKAVPTRDHDTTDNSTKYFTTPIIILLKNTLFWLFQANRQHYFDWRIEIEIQLLGV